MSDTNRTRHSFVVESTYGTSPSSNLQILRLTGDSLKQDTQTASSAEIRSDRQIPDVIRTSVSASGDLNFEFSASTLDSFMQYALMSAGWSSVVELTATTLSASAVDNSFNDSANGFGSIVAGQWIFVEGFANAANNGWFKVHTKTNGKLIVGGNTLSTESAGVSVHIQMGAQIVNGTTLKSFSLERKYDDLSNIYATYAGCCVNSFNLAVSAESIITGSLGILAKSETSRTSSFGSGYTAAGSNPVMNAVDNLDLVLLDLPGSGLGTGASSRVSINSLSFALQNNLRNRMVVGSVGPVSIGTGACNVTGTLQMYFADSTAIDKYLSFNSCNLAFVMNDGANSYLVDFPQIKFTSGQRVAGGQNQDCIVDLGFTAYRHATQDCTIRIAKFSSVDNFAV